jgi:hypothetical protein
MPFIGCATMVCDALFHRRWYPRRREPGYGTTWWPRDLPVMSDRMEAVATGIPTIQNKLSCSTGSGSNTGMRVASPARSHAALNACSNAAARGEVQLYRSPYLCS